MAKQQTQSIGRRVKYWSSNWTWHDKVLYQFGYDYEPGVIYICGAKIEKEQKLGGEYNVGLRRLQQGWWSQMFDSLYDISDTWGSV